MKIQRRRCPAKVRRIDLQPVPDQITLRQPLRYTTSPTRYLQPEDAAAKLARLLLAQAVCRARRYQTKRVSL
jgi:hypothetical protein